GPSHPLRGDGGARPTGAGAEIPQARDRRRREREEREELGREPRRIAERPRPVDDLERHGRRLATQILGEEDRPFPASSDVAKQAVTTLELRLPQSPPRLAHRLEHLSHRSQPIRLAWGPGSILPPPGESQKPPLGRESVRFAGRWRARTSSRKALAGRESIRSRR